jgi:hypothetical protein
LDTSVAKKNPKVARALKNLESHLLSPSKPAKTARTLIYTDSDNEKETTTLEASETEQDDELHYVFNTSVSSDPGEPKQYKDATKSGPERSKWIESIKAEISNFTRRQVWKKFPRSELNGRKPLKSRWVFKKKLEPDNTFRYKARVVVKGYNQIPGVDFTESFSPVATDTTTRIIFAFVLFYRNWICEIVDVEAAFLNADLEEDLYIEYPEGVVELGFETEATSRHYCILLDKAMYGAVQAARQWSRKLVEILTQRMHLTQSRVDPCLFYLMRNNEVVLIVGTHVDDQQVAGTSSDIKAFKVEMAKYVAIKQLGVVKKHLGVIYKISNDNYGRYIEANMFDFVQGMTDDYVKLIGSLPKRAATPALPGTTLEKNDGDMVMQPEYRSVVGKLLYFMKKVSPLCANATRELSQHLENPGLEHWKAVDRLLGFLQNINHCKIKMRAPTELRVLSACDTDYATKKVDRKSVGGSMSTVGGALVHWVSKGHPIVTLSSTEAEYVEMTNTVKEVSFIQQILSELATNLYPAIICEDNTGAIFLATNSQVGMRTKHIDVRYHFLRDKVEDGSIKFVYVRSEDNPSDICTKNVKQQIHDRHAGNILNGTIDCWNREDVKS